MLARKLILGFGFAVLMPLLIHYGIETFSPAPERTDQWRERSRLQERMQEASGEEKGQLRAELDRWDEAQAARQQRSSRWHFYIGAPLGILVTLVGSFVTAQAIGGGLMLGGIFTFTGGCFWYWGDLSRVGRFGVLLAAFLVLLWIGYQRLAELKTPAKRS